MDSLSRVRRVLSNNMLTTRDHNQAEIEKLYEVEIKTWMKNGTAKTL